mgnify:CR=1 FL=1
MRNQSLLISIGLLIGGISIVGCDEPTSSSPQKERTELSKTGWEGSKWAYSPTGSLCIAARNALQSLNGEALLASLRRSYETYRQEDSTTTYVALAFSAMYEALEQGESGSREVDRFFDVCSSTLGVKEQPPT